MSFSILKVKNSRSLEFIGTSIIQGTTKEGSLVKLEKLRNIDCLKVIKFWKQIFLFSFEPKNEGNCFLISALASKNGLNQKNEGS